MSKKCTFMGNTDATPSTEILNKAQTIVVDLIEKHNVTTFYCDGYGTFNFMMAQYINELKKIYPNIKSIYIATYFNKFTLSNINKTLYDDIIFPELLHTQYAYTALKRNKWIIKNVDYLIAFIQYTFGGTYKSWQYANSKKNLTKYLLQDNTKKDELLNELKKALQNRKLK